MTYPDDAMRGAARSTLYGDEYVLDWHRRKIKLLSVRCSSAITVGQEALANLAFPIGQKERLVFGDHDGRAEAAAARPDFQFRAFGIQR